MRFVKLLLFILLSFIILGKKFKQEPDYDKVTYFNQSSDFDYFDPNSAITVVIPCHERDFEILPYTIERIKKYITNKIYKIVLISEDTKEARDISKKYDLEFFDEDRIYNKKKFVQLAKKYQIEYLSPLDIKPNWLYQQLLKLEYANYSTTDDYFVIDADIILLRPLTLKNENGYHFFKINQLCNIVINNYTKKILDFNLNKEECYISDMMIFNKFAVKELIHDIVARTKLSLQEAIIYYSDGLTVFSEYETYGFYSNHILKLKSFHTTASLKYKNRGSFLKDLQNNPWSAKVPYVAYHGWVNLNNSTLTRDDIIPMIKSFF